jgi:hypothetical protein
VLKYPAISFTVGKDQANKLKITPQKDSLNQGTEELNESKAANNNTANNNNLLREHASIKTTDFNILILDILKRKL